MHSGSKFYVRESLAGPFIHDFEISGPGGFFSDGHLSAEEAIAFLTDRENWGW
jgi:hypothetical protein